MAPAGCRDEVCYGTSTVRSPGGSGRVQAASTSASGTAFGRDRDRAGVDLVDERRQLGEVDRGETAPWPLPWRRRLAERSATDGSSIVGPAIAPIWIQFIARLRSDRAVSSAMMACCAGTPHR